MNFDIILEKEERENRESFIKSTRDVSYLLINLSFCLCGAGLLWISYGIVELS